MMNCRGCARRWWIFVAVLVGVWDGVDSCGAATAADTGAVAWQASLGGAWKTAKEQGRPLVVVIGTRGCSYCTKLKNETLRDARVAADVRAWFVAVRIDADEQAAWVDKLGVTLYPTTVVISPDAKIVVRIEGYVGPDEFRKRIAAAAPRVAANRREP